MVEALYLRTLSRLPNARELIHWDDTLSKAESKREVLESALGTVEQP